MGGNICSYVCVYIYIHVHWWSYTGPRFRGSCVKKRVQCVKNWPKIIFPSSVCLKSQIVSLAATIFFANCQDVTMRFLKRKWHFLCLPFFKLEKDKQKRRKTQKGKSQILPRQLLFLEDCHERKGKLDFFANVNCLWKREKTAFSCTQNSQNQETL